MSGDGRDGNGRFRPGHSGNPEGRRVEKDPERARVRELAREKTVEAVEALAEILADTTASAMARVRAAEALLERAYGRASDETVLEAAGAISELGPIRFAFVMGEPPDELEGYVLDDDEPRALPPAA